MTIISHSKIIITIRFKNVNYSINIHKEEWYDFKKENNTLKMQFLCQICWLYFLHTL